MDGLSKIEEVNESLDMAISMLSEKRFGPWQEKIIDSMETLISVIERAISVSDDDAENRRYGLILKKIKVFLNYVKGDSGYIFKGSISSLDQGNRDYMELMTRGKLDKKT